MQSTEKPIRLVEYLIAITKTGTKITRDLNEYHSILWLNEIPRELKHCYTRAWGEEDEHGDYCWLEVKKFSEPSLPRIPDKLKPWVNQDTLHTKNDIPDLYNMITIKEEEYDEETGEKHIIAKNLDLDDYPDIKNIWNSYLENQWLPWNEIYTRHLSVQKVYAKLFHIYQEQQKLGEQYELLCCVGLLSWKTPSGHVSRRHLIAAKASIEFEPHLGKFTVRAAEDGNEVFVELDMLDIEDQPTNIRKLCEDGHQSLNDNIWDRSATDPFLSAIANSLADSGQGQYYKDHIIPDLDYTSDKPIIEFAPALILRRRSMRELENLLLEIKKRIEKGDTIPHEFLDLCESLDIEGNITTERSEGNITPAGAYPVQSSEIYFPLHANEEQRQIIRTLDRQRGVLVQGPPGTGKSHTIANLICHFLATGKRVLVTAKTPRALQVLHEKLPNEIKPLCINLLGSGSEERESLEKSVSSILAKVDQKDQSQTDQMLAQLEESIRHNRQDKVETDTKLMALRESETYTHQIIEGSYVGTAAEVARLIKQKDTFYVWFTDKIECNNQLPLNQDELDYLSKYFSEYDPYTDKLPSLYIPNPDTDLPKTEVLFPLFTRERELNEIVSTNFELLDTAKGLALLHSNKDSIQDLVNSLGQFISSLESTLKRTMKWVPLALHEVLTDKDTPWRELLRLSTTHLERLDDFSTEVDKLDVHIPADLDRKKLLYDAKALLPHFEAGKGTGVWIFKSKIVREHGAFLKTVKVDGVYCDSAERLKKLIDYLSVEQILQYVWSLWSGKVDRYAGPIPLQKAEIEELNESLGCVVELYNLRNNVIMDIGKIKGLSFHLWEEVEELRKILEICFIVISSFDLQAVTTELEMIRGNIASLVARINAHPIISDIYNTFNRRENEVYLQLIEKVKDLRNKADSVIKKHNLIEKLKSLAPTLYDNLNLCNEPSIWVTRTKNLKDTWNWARAKTWLQDFLNTDAESLERHSRRLDEEIRKSLAKLSAVKAWDFCFSRMHENQRRHLMAWQLAMKLYGKGTGKHAHTHRRNAQMHLKECRDAVPAWIMPLHRVFETVKPAPGVFDVIIIDEASQCGPEGLPLVYLGERILIVGDDKQISPEAIGIKREQVQRLMRDYLSDFKYADSFDVENSLFAHGRIRFSNRITLREHFRCMPEIINFSNDLCYSNDPLIPLRQYPPERLEPLQCVHVSSGYREGSGQRVINRPEAEAVANAVEQCCRDEKYRGMTMGVIVLQGEAQAYIIAEQLLKRLGAEEMEKRRLISGNPYSFQGDERDVIFLSLVAAPNERIGTLTQEADRRRFNVAASRAREQMWLFHSVTSNHLSEQCFRRRLLNYFFNPKSQISQALGENAEELKEMAFRANRKIEKPPLPFDSWFEVDVALDIAGRGYRVVPQYKFADKYIDLVIQGKRAQLAVECDGDHWHGADAYVKDAERQRKLERCGWQFHRIRESYYYGSRDTSLSPLWSLLYKMGINSVSDENEDPVHVNEDVQSSPLDDESSENLDQNNGDLFEDSSHISDDEQETASPSQSADNSTGSPTNIRDALRTKPDIVSRVIIEILHERPNNSCVREHMPTFILKQWNIVTRGTPRQQFHAKVDDIIANMARRGYITIYKSKNNRIKLGWVEYPGFQYRRDS